MTAEGARRLGLTGGTSSPAHLTQVTKGRLLRTILTFLLALLLVSRLDLDFLSVGQTGCQALAQACRPQLASPFPAPSLTPSLRVS